MSYAIKVIGRDGEEEFVCNFTADAADEITRYASKRAAREQVEFLKIGLGDDVQSINIVPYPKPRRGEPSK